MIIFFGAIYFLCLPPYNSNLGYLEIKPLVPRAKWLSGRVLGSRRRGRRFESHRHHCVVSLSKFSTG